MREYIEAVSSFVWGMPTVFLLLGTGAFLFLRLGKLSFCVLRSVSSALRGKARQNGVSPLEAFSTVLSGTVGIGNIVGVVAAVLAGGAGAVFWMWVSAFFGMMTNFSEVVLGQHYRRRKKDGSFTGGVFVTLTDGLGWKKIGLLTAVFTALASFGMGAAQTAQIAGALWETLGNGFGGNRFVFRLAVGAVLAGLIGLARFRWGEKIGKVTSLLLPVMSGLFLLLAVLTLLRRHERILTAFGQIFSGAFGTRAAFGGVGGYTFSQAMCRGMARGVFSNEAGMGSSVIAHADSAAEEPVEQGLWGIFAVFCDTVVMCTLSALMLLVTVPSASLTGTDTSLAVRMFSDNFGSFGVISFALLLLLLGVGSLLSWSYYGEKAALFCLPKSGRAFRFAFVLFLPLAAFFDTPFAWAFSDLFNGLMTLPNLLCLLLLGGEVKAITKRYFEKRKTV